jgi:tryptophan synthase alpha chain
LSSDVAHSKAFERLNGEGRKALIPFITAGDPEPRLTVPLMHTLVDAGADVIELGVPFSDPMADGPTIQRASERALAKGMTLRKVLQLVIEFRKTDLRTPVVAHGLRQSDRGDGPAAFRQGLRSRAWMACWWSITRRRRPKFWRRHEGAGLDPIFLLAPTSNAERIAQAQIASGYVYYVSLAGVTGSGALNVEAVAERCRPFAKRPACRSASVLASAMRATAKRIAGLPMRSSSAAGLSKKLKNRPQKLPVPTSRRWWRIFVAVWMR